MINTSFLQDKNDKYYSVLLASEIILSRLRFSGGERGRTEENKKFCCDVLMLTESIATSSQKLNQFWWHYEEIYDYKINTFVEIISQQSFENSFLI